jgi:hypothetical protein
MRRHTALKTILICSQRIDPSLDGIDHRIEVLRIVRSFVTKIWLCVELDEMWSRQRPKLDRVDGDVATVVEGREFTGGSRRCRRARAHTGGRTRVPYRGDIGEPWHPAEAGSAPSITTRFMVFMVLSCLSGWWGSFAAWLTSSGRR